MEADAVTEALRKLGYIARQNQQEDSLYLNLGGPQSEASRPGFKGAILLSPARNLIVGTCPRAILDFRSQVMLSRHGGVWIRRDETPGPRGDDRVEVCIIVSSSGYQIACDTKTDRIWVDSYAEELRFGVNGYEWDDIQRFLTHLDKYCTERQAPATGGLQAGITGRLPEEVVETPALVEGAVRQVTVNAYERNPEARRRCIAAHGAACSICEFRFVARYGPEAEGYIHVHHIRPLSEVGGEYVVDPVEDLRPVCPNCHAVLHLGGRCRTIDEVRALLR